MTGPLGAPVVARWWMADGVAVVESAAASGLPLAGGAEGNDPLRASTRGTGELLVAAASAGARRILVGVGGSATTDGGRGALDAIDEGGGLGAIEVVVACDVETRFVQAAEQFGPQKGATPAQVVRAPGAPGGPSPPSLSARYGVDVVTDIPRRRGGRGAWPGGLAALGAPELVPGFGASWPACGRARCPAGIERGGRWWSPEEGRLDASSWSGKVVGGVVRAAGLVRVPVLVVAGTVGPGGVEGTAGCRTSRCRSLSDRFGERRALA